MYVSQCPMDFNTENEKRDTANEDKVERIAGKLATQQPGRSPSTRSKYGTGVWVV